MFYIILVYYICNIRTQARAFRILLLYVKKIQDDIHLVMNIVLAIESRQCARFRHTYCKETAVAGLRYGLSIVICYIIIKYSVQRQSHGLKALNGKLWWPTCGVAHWEYGADYSINCFMPPFNTNVAADQHYKDPHISFQDKRVLIKEPHSCHTKK